MVGINDYAGINGFAMGMAGDVENLNKALNTGAYAQAGGVAGQQGGSALIVESLENSLKVLTYSDEHVKFWKKIAKTPAYSTVEEYNQLLSYGSDGGGFISEGALPDTEDSEYVRKATFVKFLGTTRTVTHPMTLVRSAHGDVLARENQNGILWIMKKMENALFWGDSTLAAGGREGVQFDGLNKMIHPDNVLDIAGKELTDRDVNRGANLIISNYGMVTDLFLPFQVLAQFSEQYFPKERVIMPTPGSGLQAGLVVNKFQTAGGAVEFNPDVFLQKTAPLPVASTGGENTPTIPASITVTLDDTVSGNFAKGVEGTGAGTYKYYVTAVNNHGESLPSAAGTIALLETDVNKGVKIVIENSASMSKKPEYFNVYRTELDGTAAFKIMSVPAKNEGALATNTAIDLNEILPNTYTCFMGQFTDDILAFKQLAPMMKMDLATLGPAHRFMCLLYGAPVLYAAKKMMKFVNIKATI